ncbi:MAG: hypothetical protein KDD67_00545 [Ignavibacteriae bacterium]|nr:hypothetical protein [Ignavibacteriota bacterium]MCB9214674.1 hypothetical protein [Ignavibacteria bacterium]
MEKKTTRYVGTVLIAVSALWIGCSESEIEKKDGVAADSIPQIGDSAKSDSAELEDVNSTLIEADSTNEDTTKVSGAEENKPVSFEWKFDVQETSNGFEGKVIATVNGKEFVVVPAVKGEYHEMEKVDYDEAGIPSTALGATISLSEEGGEILYAQQKGSQVLIFKKPLTDMSSGELKFEQIKKIDLKY